MNYIELEKIKQKALEDHIPIIMDDTLEVIEKYLKNEKITEEAPKSLTIEKLNNAKIWVQNRIATWIKVLYNVLHIKNAIFDIL